MPLDFYSPANRAAGGDLTVSVSPFGLLELSDEELEVHGPRLNRYSTCLAWYAGHHWTYRRELGEPQITLNYIRALSDYITSFTYGKSVQFRSPEQNAAIIPHLLDDVWKNNHKHKLLWEIGQYSGVLGDCFVKVAYEDPWVDSIGVPHPGRVRILPLNPSTVFPEYHPHDRDRLIRVKIKYRYFSTAPDGARKFNTYVEILTDDMVEQYVNDELVYQYPNPIGIIPVVHHRNVSLNPSPWGISDIYDIISLNRELNEKMTEVSDIVNYNAHPITIITGAKPSNLERGAKKVWAIPNSGAKVENLESHGDMGGAVGYVEFIKRVMHELTGVPESALGQVQPISNTSGVALAIQYQPMMNRWRTKITHASKALEEINALIIRTIAVHAPERLTWDPSMSSLLEQDQLSQLDPTDPLTYVTECHWPEPLPVDQLAKLQEIQAKMALGLESKKSALAALDEDFPAEKLAEIYEELREDALNQGALEFINAKIASAIIALTGQLPGGEGPVEQSVTTAGDAGEQGVLPPIPPPDPDTVNQIVSRSFGAGLTPRKVQSDDS